MTDRIPPLLAELLDIPAPSGFELPAARRWLAAAGTFADASGMDSGGNAWATVNPEGRPALLFAGHVDEIGVMVVHVDEQGFCWFDTIGGWDSQVFVGQRVTLLSRGGPVAGVVGKKAIHLQEPDDRTKVSKVADLWIDIGATSRAEALERVRVGDPGVLVGRWRRSPAGGW